MRTTTARVGQPDRSQSGSTRHLDRRRSTRNDLRTQHGFDFERLMTPSGTTAHRPTLPDEGDIRYNTTLATYEGYSGSAWLDLSATVVSTWLDLTDTDPASFGDAAGQAVQVNEAGTGLEFAGAVSIPVAPIEFSANGSFSYTHNRGEQPVVSVTDSSGHEIEVCVQHPTVNTVSLSFIGTLTDAVLIFN